MKLLQSTYQNNNSKIIKYLSLIIFIFILSFKANTEISEKYKIESLLLKCTGTDYKIWNNCYGEYVFPRNEYKGEWKDGSFHGQGILREAWGAIYIGGFKNNMAEGYGRQEEPDGSWWEGEIKNDKLHGKAILYEARDKCRSEGIFKDLQLNGPGKIKCEVGLTSEGNYKNGSLNGQGIFISADGSEYSGEWLDGQLNGQGFIRMNTGAEYSGEFIKDKLNGQGEIKWLNGTIESGQFVDDILNGPGFIRYANGEEYSGELVDGKLNSQGFWIGASGDKYYGDFKKNKFHGKGKYIYATEDFFEGEFQEDYKIYGTLDYTNGDKYIGQFKNNKRHGNGKYVYANGNKYAGEWKNGSEHGKGIFTWYDGEKYEGDWLEGYRTGQGKYNYASGTVYKGDFLNNYAEGNGKFTYENGSIYKGEIKDGYEHGQGTMEYANDDKYIGQWKEGYKHGEGKMFYANGDISKGLWENNDEVPGKTTLAKFTTDEKYYALIIGNNDYEKLEDLDNAVNDATDLEQVLSEKYGFETTLKLDQKADEIIDLIIDFTQNRKKNDNILIYYAGHGQEIKKQKRGYWLPTDASGTLDSKWINNIVIKDFLLSSPAKHILLIVDSCFAGSLMRGSAENKSVERLNQKSIKRLQGKKTRVVMTSGGNEQVADAIGDSKNSVFAAPLIKALKDNNDVIRSIELFLIVEEYVIKNAEQSPNRSSIFGTGDDGGDFLFFPKS